VDGGDAAIHNPKPLSRGKPWGVIDGALTKPGLYGIITPIDPKKAMMETSKPG
jgi:hypothetical protein